MEFELEELKEELNELLNELNNIKNFNIVGLDINHNKFGKGKVLSQNEFSAKIKFANEEKTLQIPFIFANNIVECNDVNITRLLKHIYELQENIKSLETEIRLKEKEIELYKQKNKVLNYNLFAVTTGISYDYILQTKIYCCKSYRCKQICDYLGLYKDKSIVKIAEIKKIIEAEVVNGKLTTVLIKGKDITDEEIEAIREYISKGFDLFNCDIGSQKHKYFIVEKFYDTDFRKISNGGLMEHKYFDLYDKLGVEKMPNIEIIADKLQDIVWDN